MAHAILEWQDSGVPIIRMMKPDSRGEAKLNDFENDAEPEGKTGKRVERTLRPF